MRIGSTEDINKSDKSDNLIRLLQPENHKPLTKAQKFKNWWHYRKWYVIGGIILLVICLDLAGNALGLFTKSPDLQIAYVGKHALQPDAVNALQQTFGALAEDYNGDGEILVQINQYIRDISNTDVETMQYQYASEVALIGDISECESYFFLMDDPGKFQQEYQLLAAPDGSCPGQADYAVEDKVFLWTDCPLLTGQVPAHSAEVRNDQAITGTEERKAAAESGEALAGLYLGRRCFYTGQLTDNAEACSALWDLLYGSCNISKGR